MTDLLCLIGVIFILAFGFYAIGYADAKEKYSKKDDNDE